MPIPVFSLMLVVFSLTTGEFVIAGILPEVANDLAVSIPAAGLLITAYAVGMIVGGPVVTVLTARVARKQLVVALVVVAVIGNLASVVAPNYPILLGTRFVAGLVVATFFAVAITIAVSMASADKQASTVANLVLGMNLGIILSTPLGTVVGQNLGWRVTFAVVVALSLAGLLLVVRFVPTGPAAAAGSVLWELRVFADRDLQLAIALTAVGNVGIVMVFSYISPLLTDVSGFASDVVPVLLLVYGTGAVIGNLVGGRLSDAALMPSLIGILAVLAGVLTLFWFASGGKTAAAILTFVIGACAFAIIPGMQTRVLNTASAAPTLAVAVNAAGFQVAAAFAGWLGGRVIDSGAGLRSIYIVAALLTVAGVCLAVYSMRRDRRPVLIGS